jgi:AcrR family transcriptional regulator
LTGRNGKGHYFKSELQLSLKKTWRAVAGLTSLKKAEHFTEQENGSTKERLLQVAQELFAQKGFHGTSTREITRRARTNLSSLYFHWQSKENLYIAVYRYLFELLTNLAQEVVDLLEEGLRSRKPVEKVIDPVVDRALEFFDANRQLARLNLYRVLEDGALAEQIEKEFENPLYQAVARCYQRLTAEGLIKVSDPELLTLSLEILLDYYFANPERIERSLGLDREAVRVRLRNHFRETFLRLLKVA